jgi:hypothetical protein
MSAPSSEADVAASAANFRFGPKPTSAKGAGLSAKDQQHAQICSVAWLPGHDGPMKVLAVEHETTPNALAVEAFNDLVKKHGKRQNVGNPLLPP